MRPRKVPRGTFWIGGLAALAVDLPLSTVALAFLAARLGIGPAGVTQAHIGTLALVFAGVPALLTGGGVARLVAHRLVESAAPSAWRALVTGALAMAVGGVGLMVLVAVPLGGLPERAARWWPLGVAGLAAGAATGLAIGVLVGGRALRHRARAEAQT